MHSRNIPMAEKRIVYFQSNISEKLCADNIGKYVVFFISNNYYIYLKRYFEKIVINDFLVYFEGQLL